MTRAPDRRLNAVVVSASHLEDPMALAEQHAIFRAYILLMTEVPDALPVAEALDRLGEAAREGEAARVAREYAGR